MLNTNNMSGPGDAIMAATMLVACLLIGCYPMLKMMSWWAEGSVDPLLAIISIFLFLVLTVSCTLMPFGVGLFILILFAALALSVPILGKASDNLQLKKMEKERIQNYAAVLEKEPMNHAARTGLAEAIHKRGDPGDLELAIQHLEWVLQNAPALSFRYKPMLDSWRREKERVVANLPPPMICHLCHAENPWNATSCENCAAAFGTRTGVMQQMNYQGGPLVVIRGWVVTATAATIALFSLMILPSIIAGPIIIATVIVAAWLFMRWVGGNMGTIGD
jgi:ribosomal protein L40E